MQNDIVIVRDILKKIKLYAEALEADGVLWEDNIIVRDMLQKDNLSISDVFQKLKLYEEEAEANGVV